MRLNQLGWRPESSAARKARYQSDRNLNRLIRHGEITGLFGPGRECNPGHIEHYRGRCTGCSTRDVMLWQALKVDHRPNGAGHAVTFGNRLCVYCVPVEGR